MAKEAVNEILREEALSRKKIIQAKENADLRIEEAKIKAKVREEEILRESSLRAEEIIAQAENNAKDFLLKAEREACEQSKLICSIPDSKKNQAVSAVIDCVLNR